MPLSLFFSFGCHNDSSLTLNRQMPICNLCSDLRATTCVSCINLHPTDPITDLSFIVCHDSIRVMCYTTPQEESYGKSSSLTVFIVFWVVLFALSYYGSSDLYIDPSGEVARPVVGPFIFSTMIAFLIACACYAAGGGVRDRKELTDGITWDHI